MIFALPAAPFASTVTISFVLMSPSTEIMLNVTSVISERACCRSLLSIAASVVMKESIVAMFG